MLQLTDEQLRSLARHKIPVGAVLDARGMQTAVWKNELKRHNKALALVDSSCRRGHAARLRLSSGHCVDCSPQGAAHWKRHQEPAFVYIAVSARLKLIKIGIAKTASERAESLIRDGYGGSDDWFVGL
jgi:hypothetical protein